MYVHVHVHALYLASSQVLKQPFSRGLGTRQYCTQVFPNTDMERRKKRRVHVHVCMYNKLCTEALGAKNLYDRFMCEFWPHPLVLPAHFPHIPLHA